MSARAPGHDLGVRNGFYDIAQTLAEAFGVGPRPRGLSFLDAVA
jgi:phosphopentomutase